MAVQYTVFELQIHQSLAPYRQLQLSCIHTHAFTYYYIHTHTSTYQYRRWSVYAECFHARQLHDARICEPGLPPPPLHRERTGWKLQRGGGGRALGAPCLELDSAGVGQWGGCYHSDRYGTEWRGAVRCSVVEWSGVECVWIAAVVYVGSLWQCATLDTHLDGIARFFL